MSHRSNIGRSRGRYAAAGVAIAGLALVGVAAPATATFPAASADPAAPDSKTEFSPSPVFKNGRYVVLLQQAPTAAYDGGLTGYAATGPADGKKFDADSRAARRYDGLLDRRQERIIARADISASAVSARFTTVTNGFTADLRAKQAAALSKDPAVLAVTPDELRKPTTNKSPRYLGLRGPNGLWKQLGKKGTDGAGSSTVIGVVDSGIWPESRSFRSFNKGDSRAATADSLGYTGDCDPGDDGSFAGACNNKLIGGRYYVDGFGAGNVADFEYLSPRDAGGHGTHTASTSAGRYVKNPKSEGTRYTSISGMAPAARLAPYKVCWDAAPGASGGCFTSDSVAAINDAVADGVDAINYSISGSQDSYIDPVEIAFLNAAAANVFVAASSGNSGPDASTTAHPSPWITTVAASTHKILESTVELGNGDRYVGASLTEGLPQTSAVLAVDSAADGSAAADAQLCTPGSLDPAALQDKIVVCDRGVIARVDKSFAVDQAGGAGMILINPPGEEGVNADNHFVPTVHLETPAYDPIYAYVGGNPDATAAILAGVAEGSDTQVPEVAAFSSRGPSLAGGGDVLKPDISAPGVDVLASVVPTDANYGRKYDFYSGTSMSSPHIAGLGLLLRDLHPAWTPMEIKSAMMSTAFDHATTTSAFEQGAGFVNPREFGEPGLVYDADVDDWADFLLGQGVDIGYPGARALDASQLNQPSIAVNELAGKERVRRTVTNVSDETLYLRPTVSGLDGIDVDVRPRQLMVSPGAKATYKVTFSHAGAPFGEYAQGHLTWKSRDFEVRSPMVVNPVSVAAPAEVSGTGTDGSLTYDITAGADATIDLTVNGLSKGVVEEGTLAPGALTLNPAGNASTAVSRFQVDAGTSLARFDLDAADDADDFDLFVVNEAFTAFAGQSATGSADERVDLIDPEPGNYYVFVNAFATSDGQPGEYTLTNYAVGTGPAGNMTVDPQSIDAQLGETYPVTLDWAGLDPAPYLGWVGYSGSEQPTIVSIDAGR